MCSISFNIHKLHKLHECAHMHQLKPTRELSEDPAEVSITTPKIKDFFDFTSVCTCVC